MAKLADIFKHLDTLLLSGNLIAELKNIKGTGSLKGQMEELNRMIKEGKIPENLKQVVEQLQEKIQEVKPAGFDDETYFGNALMLLPLQSALDVVKGLKAIKDRRSDIKEGKREQRNFIACIATQADESRRAQWLQHIVTLCSPETPPGSGNFIFDVNLFLDYVDNNDMLENPSELDEYAQKVEELAKKAWEEATKIQKGFASNVDDISKEVKNIEQKMKRGSSWFKRNTRWD